MSHPVLVDKHAGWLKITLNRPAKLNAFNSDMFEALFDAFEQARSPEIRAVLLTGAGRGFCAGQDLAERMPGSEGAKLDLGQALRERYNPIVQTISDFPKPVLCAVNGVAAGAGANLALACDIVLAAKSAIFIQSFAKIGLVPDAGGTHRLAQIIGPQRAKAWSMTADPLDADTAQHWGLVWQVCEDETLTEVAENMARDFAQGPTVAFSQIKKLVHDAAGNDLATQLEAEAAAQSHCGQTLDHHEGIAAFLQKRSPQFKGE